MSTASPRKSADNQLVVRAFLLPDKARAKSLLFGKNIVQPARRCYNVSHRKNTRPLAHMPEPAMKHPKRWREAR